MERSLAVHIADRIIGELFVNGGGQEADRLMLVDKQNRDLGGWCKGAVRDRIVDAIVEMTMPLAEPSDD